MSGSPRLGMGPRRFLWRWNARVLRREWRQHVAIFILIATAVAVSIAGVLSAYHLVEPPENTYGTAEVIASTAGDASVPEQALIDQGLTFGVVQTANLAVTGSARRLPIKVQDPDDEVTAPLLDLVDGRWPTAPDEVAVTDRAPLPGARADIGLGTTLDIGKATATVVGLVENPTDLGEEFVLATELDRFEIPIAERSTLFLIDAKPADVTFPAGSGRVTLASRASLLDVRTAVALAVNGVAAVAMLEVALLVGAGFAVLARRRTRQFGLLGAAGATPRQIRAAATAAGTIIGLAASAVGLVIGIAAAAAIVPAMETTVGHRISFSVPWWTVVPTVAMAAAAAAIGSRWPSRPLSKQPIAHLLNALRPQPTSAGRLTVLGGMLAIAGAAAIIVGFARLNTALAVIGIVIGPIGLLLLAPLLVGLLGRWSTGLPVAARLGGRAVARHNRRSAAVVAALAIALGIPTGAAVVTTSIDQYNLTKAPNLDERSVIAWVPGAEQPIPHIPAYLLDGSGAAADSSDAGAIERLRSLLPNGRLAPIEVAVPPDAPVEQENFDRIGSVASVIPAFAVERGEDCFNCDIFSFGTVDEDGEEILYIASEAWIADPALLDVLSIGPLPAEATAVTREDGMIIAANTGLVDSANQGIIFDATLPVETGIAPTLVAPETVAELGFDRATIGWLIVSDDSIGPDDRTLITEAVGDEFFAEFQDEPGPGSTIRIIALLAGLAIGLGITVAAVSLFTTESADDVRILESIGAAPRTARKLSASVAGTLAGAGAIIAVLIGYLALLPLLTIEDIDFPFVVPWLSLGGFGILFPLLAASAGWLTNGRHNTSLARSK